MPLEKSPLHGSPARVVSLADQCGQFGPCLPVCPTCALDRNEAESPRGRIAIASALARSLADPASELREHLDHCLGFLNCEQVCPAHVQYDGLLIETRALPDPAGRRPRFLIHLLAHPHRLAAQSGAGWLRLSRRKNRLARYLLRTSPGRSAWLLPPAVEQPGLNLPNQHPLTLSARQFVDAD